uniref:DUF4200 domain-containing protein n=2 Tax=Trichobilharzia regenti TaxID=157069 RepID=A0AA85JK35_TRIRE|nr:unnamed protein product [Trichobilharzia regenti]
MASHTLKCNPDSKVHEQSNRPKFMHQHTLKFSKHYPIMDDPIEECKQRLVEATAELKEKRKVFAEKMAKSREQRVLLQHDVNALEERKLKCQSFIRDNDAKRWRALQKFCTDNHLCTVKKKERQNLISELRKAKELYASLLAKVANLKKYETYLQTVVDSLPKDYIKLADDAIIGLIMRYNSLHSTNERLKREMETKAEELRQAQNDLRKLKESHRFLLFNKNSELSALYSERECLDSNFQATNSTFVQSHDDLVNQLSFFMTVIRAINNLTGKLLRTYDITLCGQTLLSKIQKMTVLSRCHFIEDRISTIRTILAQIVTDTGQLPVCKCCRPQLTNQQIAGVIATSPSELAFLIKLTTLPSERHSVVSLSALIPPLPNTSAN